jgi:hypothetical protein
MTGPGPGPVDDEAAAAPVFWLELGCDCHVEDDAVEFCADCDTDGCGT